MFDYLVLSLRIKIDVRVRHISFTHTSLWDILILFLLAERVGKVRK